jgi:hypothetical protein
LWPKYSSTAFVLFPFSVMDLMLWNDKDFDCGFTSKHAIKIADPACR